MEAVCPTASRGKQKGKRSKAKAEKRFIIGLLSGKISHLSESGDSPNGCPKFSAQSPEGSVIVPVIVLVGPLAKSGEAPKTVNKQASCNHRRAI
jgi:hypothetical protein